MNSGCSAQNADTCWTAVAQGLGYDTSKISACFSAHAQAYAEEDLRMTTLFGVSGSPQVFIDGVEFGGSRTTSGFATGVFAAFQTSPGACSSIPHEEEQAAPVAGGCG